jgi:hypothetical protein
VDDSPLAKLGISHGPGWMGGEIFLKWRRRFDKVQETNRGHWGSLDCVNGHWSGIQVNKLSQTGKDLKLSCCVCLPIAHIGPAVQLGVFRPSWSFSLVQKASRTFS